MVQLEDVNKKGSKENYKNIRKIKKNGMKKQNKL
jgi:hypothetical protein